MDGEVAFEPDCQTWQTPRGLKQLSLDEISAIYARAHQYFVNKATLLREDLNWYDVVRTNYSATLVCFRKLDYSLYIQAEIERSLLHIGVEFENDLYEDEVLVTTSLRLPRLFGDLLDANKPTYGATALPSSRYMKTGRPSGDRVSSRLFLMVI